MRILLIEDDETLCQTIPFQLRQEGFSVDVAMNGDDGLHCAREQLHDLILLDRMLPGMDGFGVLEYMKEKDMLEQIPVVIVTDDSSEATSVKAFEYKVADMVIKPFEPRIIKRRVQNIIELYADKNEARQS